MSDDILFKNSLLGFKREDVISYIEEIKNEAENAKNSIKDNESELSNALDKIDVLQEQIKIKDQLIEKLEVENEDLKAKKNLQNNEKAAYYFINTGVSGEAENLAIKYQSLLGSEKEFGTKVIKAYNSTAEVDLDKEQVSKLLSEDAARESKELEMYEQEFQQSSRDFANLVDDLSCNIRKLTDNLMAASKSTSQKEDQKGEKVLCEDAKQQDKEEDLKTDIKDVADENEIIDEYKVRLQEDEVDMASDELVEMYTNDPDGNADPVSIDDSKYVMVKKVIKIKKDK